MELRCNHMIRKAVFSLFLSLTIATLAGLPAQAQGGAELKPGFYQATDGSATCRLAPNQDGSWLLSYWEGTSLEPPPHGLAWWARLVRRSGTGQWAGIWQALPGSCCPGRGRLELEALDNQGIRFTLFTPSLDSPAWPQRRAREFRLSAPLPAPHPLQQLAGMWRLRLWYTDLLPNQQPADPEDGLVRLQADKGRLRAQWQDQPGSLEITVVDGSMSLVYSDPKAGFKLEAALGPLAGGLAYSGAFKSTLGSGSMYLVRRAAPASPPGGAAEPEGALSGLWVDPRTGNDFVAITQKGAGFSFETFGGSRARPRYLSQGAAQPAGSDLYRGKAADSPRHCCGNQGRLIFRRLGPDRLEVRSFWWPRNQPDPGLPESNPYVLVRVKKKQPAASQGTWPTVFDSRPGIMGQNSGALRVVFTPRPKGPREPSTLFAQGGYRRELELFLDAGGRLAARLATEDGRTVRLHAEQPISLNQRHSAWLIYRAGDAVRLYLDKQQVARAALPSPWAGSVAPYLLGASRWPGRVFSGSIERADLWSNQQDPVKPGPPQLSLTPSTPTGQAGGQPEDRLRTLHRLWHPMRLVHAYAVDQDRIRALTAQGFRMQGPLGRLHAAPLPGLRGLWAHEHGQLGYTVITGSQTPPQGCKPLGLLGYAPGKASQDTRVLWEAAGAFGEPLRKRRSADRLYTTRPDQAKAAEAFGYGQARQAGLLLAADEPELSRPALYAWTGAWQGEGWGRFYMVRQGRWLYLFWYYSSLSGPHYFGRYRLSADGLSAQGMAVGSPGPRATYYRHQLRFITDAAAGPRIALTSWRLAAPLLDGRLVQFKHPKATRSLLTKQGQAIPAQERKIVAARAARPQDDPARLYQAALQQFQAAGRLLLR